MEREKVAIVVLLAVLALAVVLLLVGNTRSTEIDEPAGSGGKVPGRHVLDSELSGSCLKTRDNQRVIDGTCLIRVSETSEPFWGLPLVGRWLPKEARRIDVRVEPENCSAVLNFQTGRIEYEDVELNVSDGRDASLTVRPEEGRLRVAGFSPFAADCFLVVDTPG